MYFFLQHKFLRVFNTYHHKTLFIFFADCSLLRLARPQQAPPRVHVRVREEEEEEQGRGRRGARFDGGASLRAAAPLPVDPAQADSFPVKKMIFL